VNRFHVGIGGAVLCLLSPFGFGQASPLDFQRVAPKVPQLQAAASLPAPEKADLTDDTPVLDKLEGIVLLSEPSRVQPNGWGKLSGVHTVGEGLIASPKLTARLASFLGKPATFGKLQEISAEIIRFYRDSNRPVVDAQLPEQNVTNGVVQILVVEGRAGRILAEDQRWFSESRILRAIRTRVGDFITANRLLDDLNWLNRNPFRRSELLFRKGESHGQTDIIVKTSDRFPLRPYIAYDNWGTDLTGNHRLQAGVLWGNAFGLDQTLAYQFSTAPDPRAFTAHAVTWAIPLPWRHVLEFYGSYARSRPTQAGVDFDAESLQLGILYTVPLPSISAIKHEVSLGLEFKQSNNNLLFGGTSIFESASDIFQFRLSYLARQSDPTGATTLQASVYYSPGGVTDDNSDAAFQQGRASAEAEYFYGRATLQRMQNLPWKLSAIATVSGQLSSTNLLASEQFSLGGGTSVRGYEESIANGDQGWLASVEVYSPPLPVLRRLRAEAPEDELKLLVFFDAGGVANMHRLRGERSHQALAGVGAGLRYRINTRFSLRFDYAWALIDIADVEIDDSRAYLSASLSY
jgi:hemolysin activation/secretion protein